MGHCTINPHGTDHYWLVISEPGAARLIQKCLFCEDEQSTAGVVNVDLKGEYL